MLRNYFKTAWRNLSKNKGFTAINITGLSIGLATCLLIFLYVSDELHYDQYNAKASRIYRIDNDIRFGGGHFIQAVTPEPLGARLKNNFPEVEQQTRLRDYSGFLVRKGSQNVQEERVIYADSTLFEVFTLPVIAGNPKTALVNPNSVVITETTAKKYFNSTDVIGRSLLLNDANNVKITAVIKDIPRQSHFSFDFFVSLNGNIPAWEINRWSSNNMHTYVVLKKGTDLREFETKLSALVSKYVEPELNDLARTQPGEKTERNWRFTVMPLTSIHLYSNKTAELGVNGSIEFVYIFSVIAVFILLIACVNFMNLSTARSSIRAKEVGIRKVLGSMRSSLVARFLAESLLMTFLSLFLAVCIAALMLPLFNQLAGKEISSVLFFNPQILLAMLLLVCTVGLLAGSYPAFYLSAFKPIDVLKGKLAAGFKSGWLRSGLVIFQFWISIILIIGTIVIYNQLHYIRSRDIGFQRDNILVIKNTYPLDAQDDVFENEMLKVPGVKASTMTGYLPTSGWRRDNPLFEDAVPNQKSALLMQIWNVDQNYIPTLGMQLAKGRNFSKEMPTDSMAVILNETAARMLSFKDPIGKNLYHIKDFRLTKNETAAYHVIGVVKNFNFNSLREQVAPLALMLKHSNGNMAFRLNTANATAVVKAAENKWKSMVPSQPFLYSFMDQDFNNTYNTEQRTGQLFIVFAVLAIVIASLGLFGLVTYAAEQRTKEIGIRKVLGASAGNIVRMLSTDFARLVIISALVAFPVAWWAMNRWLQDFAYRVQISWWIFLAAGALALFIALATVSVQAIRASLANPTDSLRSE